MIIRLVIQPRPKTKPQFLDERWLAGVVAISYNRRLGWTTFLLNDGRVESWANEIIERLETITYDPMHD